MKFNIHYLTYPLLVLVAAGALYFTGQQHQKAIDKAKATQDSLATRASEIQKAKVLADSLAKDSIIQLQVKIDNDKKVTVVLSKQRDSLKKEVAVAKDTAHLVVALKAEVAHDDSTITSQANTIIDQDKTILFLKADGVRKDKQFADLAKLNTDTNAKLAKANADANPGLAKRIVKNLDLVIVAGAIGKLL